MRYVSLIALGLSAGAFAFPTRRIVGGTEAKPKKDDFSFFARVRGCGATLISNCHILGASHCKDSDDARIGAYLSDMESDNDGEPYVDVDIKTITRHPNYNVDSFLDNDIAVYRLKKCLSPDDLNSITIPDVGATKNLNKDQELVTFGFGRDGNTGPQSMVLNKAELVFWPEDDCKKNEAGYDKGLEKGGLEIKLTESMLCAGYPPEDYSRLGTCPGDSGGPLLNLKGSTPDVVGVVSWGKKPCGEYPQVYANTRNLRGWIKDQVCDDADLTVAPICGLANGGDDQPPTGGYTPPTTAELKQAVKEYCDDDGDEQVYNNVPIGQWDLSSVTSLQQVFGNRKQCSRPLKDIGNWNVGKVTNFRKTFRDSIAPVAGTDLSEWDVSKGKDFYQMFWKSKWDGLGTEKWEPTAKTGEDYRGMFKNAREFRNVDHSNWVIDKNARRNSMYDANKDENRPQLVDV